MDATKIIEQIALELMVKRSIDVKAVQPLLNDLKQHKSDAAFSNLLVELEKQLVAGGAKGSNEFEQSLSILESLSMLLQPSNAAPELEVSGELQKSGTPAAAELIEFDRSHGPEILESFFAEVSGHLECIEQNLLKLESNPKLTDSLNAVFGAMHSLKGIMGFLDVKCGHELAHEAEAVMDAARKSERGASRSECDAMLRAVDLLREIKTRIVSHVRTPGDRQPVVPPACKILIQELRVLARRETVQRSNSEKISEPCTEAQAVLEVPAEQALPAVQIERASSVRVKVEKLDNLMESIGELVVIHAQVYQDPELRCFDNQRLLRNLSQLGKITRDLQALATALRMYPLRELFGRMNRIARDVAHKQNKDLEVVIVGDDTELDKNVIEALVDPLTHLVRNAVDHGVDLPEDRRAAGKPDRARLTISARHQSGNVIVTVEDDGRGLNFEKIVARGREKGLIGENESPSASRLRNLIFEPGFSTAERVTEISGRGMGLDVVRRNIQELGGHVAVESEPGQSTSFILTLPLTLAIIDGLIIRTDSERYIVPITSIVESVRPARKDVFTIQSRGEVINVRGMLLPIVRISEFAGSNSSQRHPSESIVMIVECGGERCGLMVDEILGQQQVVIRSLGERLKSVRGIASGAILADGRVGLILDVSQILQTARDREIPLGLAS
jgi:two-component system chemotaxis sensor kinase CheA